MKVCTPALPRRHSDEILDRSFHPTPVLYVVLVPSTQDLCSSESAQQ
jgi:hypothetical protein